MGRFLETVHCFRYDSYSSREVRDWAIVTRRAHLSPRESEGICFAGVGLCVCVCVCLSVTTITKKIVDGFVPNITGWFLEGKGRPSSCFVTSYQYQLQLPFK